MGAGIGGVRALGWSPKSSQPLPSPHWASVSSLVTGVLEHKRIPKALSALHFQCLMWPSLASDRESYSLSSQSLGSQAHGF